MAFSTYTELKAKVARDLNRTDLTADIVDFIALCEADMQIRLKLLEFESTATVTVTSGVGTLPTDFAGMRSCYWDAATDIALEYITPDAFDALRNDSTNPLFYTFSGSTVRVSPSDTGSLVMTYNARFSALSGSVASNAILAKYPNAYLYGALAHGCIFVGDDAGAAKYSQLFNNSIERIERDNEDRKYAGDLAVRVR